MRKIVRALGITLGIVACCSAFAPVGVASAAAADAAASTDIPSAYVVYDGTKYYLINYENLLDSYIFYLDNPDSDGAKLAKFYFTTLQPGVEEHFSAYVSGITKKYVSFGAVLDKYIQTEDVGATYGWFNTDEATPAFGVMTELRKLGPDGSVTGSTFVGPNGYEVTVVIDNPSVETVDPNDPTHPEHWSNNAWGTNTATFTYPNEGHTGSRSVKVEVTGYVDGDAKWSFDPIPLAPGDYVFCDYYRSDVDTSVIVAVGTSSGGTQYMDLPFAPKSETWTKYEAAFTMPENGVTVSVYHVLKKDGYLITDDYRIGLYRYEGFDRGLVTLTFDDGWEENTATALPLMQQHGYKSNQFYATTFIENEPWADPELIRLFIDDGHEVGSHSITHPDLTTLTAQGVVDELIGSQNYLQTRFGISVRYFATPFGAYNTSVKNSIMAYYDVHRTVDSGYNSKDNLDVTRLKCMSILSTTTQAEVAQWVQKAKTEKLWLVLLYHRVADNPGDYDTTPSIFAQHMQAIQNAGIPVVTITQALAEIEGQSK